jgi:hypothetical protein
MLPYNIKGGTLHLCCLVPPLQTGIKRKNGEKSPFRKNQKPTIKKSYE